MVIVATSVTFIFHFAFYKKVNVKINPKYIICFKCTVNRLFIDINLFTVYNIKKENNHPSSDDLKSLVDST